MPWRWETVSIMTAERTQALEKDLVSEFARIMHEWGHKPFRRGEIALPTQDEAFYRLLWSPYATRVNPIAGREYVPLPRSGG